MAIFTGTGTAESIQPGFVSPTVTTDGAAAPDSANDLLQAGGGDDTLDGGGGSNFLLGEAGNDRLIWNPGGGSDTFEGGTETDTAQVNGSTVAEQFSATANGARVRFDGISPVAFTLDIGTVEKLELNMGGGSDSFSATGNLSSLIAITVDGGTGNDTILGSNGADTLFGGDDDDLVDGNQGSDTALLGNGNDVFQWDPGDGNDVVEGEGGTDTLRLNGSNVSEHLDISANGGRVRFFRDVANITLDINDVEQLDINALGGSDAIVVNDLTGTDLARININLAASGGVAGDATADSVLVSGGNGNDALSISNSAAALVMVSFADGIDSFTIQGGAGNDTITAGTFDLALSISGGSESDTVSYADATSWVGVDLANPGDNQGVAVTHGYSSIESVIGSAFDDLLTGNGSANTLDGGAGADYLQGWFGDDTYIVDNAGDTVIELANGGANDKVFASVSYALTGPARVETLSTMTPDAKTAINLTGNNFAQSLVGNAGANKLKGLGGDDFLFGGKGKDTLDGGLGKDSFVFNTKVGVNHVDIIKGFVKADDTILLDNDIFTALTATGPLARSAFHKSDSGTAHDLDDRILYEKDTGKIFYDRDGIGFTHAPVQIAVLQGHPNVGVLDFVIV